MPSWSIFCGITCWVDDPNKGRHLCQSRRGTWWASPCLRRCHHPPGAEERRLAATKHKWPPNAVQDFLFIWLQVYLKGQTAISALAMSCSQTHYRWTKICAKPLSHCFMWWRILWSTTDSLNQTFSIEKWLVVFNLHFSTSEPQVLQQLYVETAVAGMLYISGQQIITSEYQSQCLNYHLSVYSTSYSSHFFFQPIFETTQLSFCSQLLLIIVTNDVMNTYLF